MRISSDVKSETRCTNTGGPQRTVLSSFLVSLDTADCSGQQENTAIIKSADGTGVTGLITDDDNSHYRQQISELVDCCDEYYMWKRQRK